MLAAQLEDYDLTGQWVAHHLAELVSAADEEGATTIEQRIAIIDTIRRLWTSRRSFPGPVPAREFDNVFAALEGLGNTSRWAYSKLSEYAKKLSEPEAKDLPLVRTAAELERLNREAVLTLLSLAFHNAEETSAGWMQALEGLEAEIADDLIDTVSVIKRRLRIFMAAQSEQDDDAGPQAQEVEADLGDPDDNGPRDDHEDPASNLNHARRLREMADLLNNVADALAPPSAD
ncbi:hypothetical protein [Nocardioides sp.]|uniref:hypothetical protein n=1 Tax=Nocardioides sp. TaxID=35761 RepID=UPI0026247F99|nr:hypothetical protein [Nocardioides sp.]